MSNEHSPFYVVLCCICLMAIVAAFFNLSYQRESEIIYQSYSEAKQIQMRDIYAIEAGRIAETCEKQPANKICG